MAAIDQVVDWAEKELPDWQGDAVRRILTQDELDAQDKVDLLAMLKERCGLGDPAKPAPKAVPITKGQLSGVPQTKVGIVLKAIQAVKNVNAIPDDSYIPFGHEGVSIIYGENGAGKSGYGRILKRACSARDLNEPIHPNIFASASSGPASAVFKIGVNGNSDQEIPWVDGGVKNDLLANILVFDAKGARVIVDEENDITFLPYGTHVFDRLCGLLKKFHATLEAEKPSIGKLEFKDIPQYTTSGKFLSAVTITTSATDLDAATAWTDIQTKRLSVLKANIAEAQSPDRNAKIRRLKNIGTLTKSLQTELLRASLSLSDEKVLELKTAINNVVSTTKALEVVARQSTGKEPLPGIGSEVWQTLYLAAKEYSTQTAYPAQVFPVTGQDSRCVLCMQPLSSEAQERFKRFYEFMEQETKKKVVQAEAVLKSILDNLKSLDLEKFTTDLSQEIQERNSKLAQDLELFITAMKKRKDQMIQGGTLRSLDTVEAAGRFPAKELAQTLEAIAIELTNLEKGLTLAELQAFKAEVEELEARQALLNRKEEVLTHLSLLQKVKRYNDALGATSIVAVSARGKKIISAAITPDLQRALREELSGLGAAHLPLDIKPTRSDGEVVYKLSLTEGKLPKKTSLTAILSEGEQRVVAIAGFLAELAVSGVACPIVLDDPVCSLDHKFQKKIASRLAKVARHRQVVVFTHDIGFLVELLDCAAEMGDVKVATQTIRRKGMVPGYSAQGNPWHAMKVTERTELLLTKKLPQFEALHNKDMEKYNPAAAEVYGMLRETWEALVEEELLNKVIRRHGAEIKTMSLSGVEVSTEDYKTIYFAMKKCSEWMTGHDKSKALDVDRPDPNEIKQDINSVLQLRKVISDRRKKTSDDRAKAITPAKPAIG